MTRNELTSREFLQSVLESMPFPIAVIGRKLEVLHTNKAMRELAGMDRPDEAAGLPCHSLFHDREESCESCPHRIVLATRAPVVVEQCSSRAGRPERITEVHAAPLLNSAGEVEAVIKAIHDITERRRAEDEQLRRVKLEGVLEMAGAACHEVGQPLHNLMLLAGMLGRCVPPEDPGHKILKEIQAEVQRLGDITGKIMRITRYAAKEYLEGITIVDIDGALEPEDIEE